MTINAPDPVIHGLKTNTRYDIVVQGIMFAADTSKRYRRGEIYVNVRLNPRGQCWGARHLMFNTNNRRYPFVFSKRNVTAFVVERDGSCRPAKAQKEKVMHLEDKSKVETNWRPYAAALAKRVGVNK